MDVAAIETVRPVIARFSVPGIVTGVTALGNGHIHRSWCVTLEDQGKRARYVLQQVNTRIFSDPAALMQNIERVTAHVAGVLGGLPDRGRRVLTVIPCADGKACCVDDDGACWRMYTFIEGAEALEVAQTPGQAYEAARAFGRFQQQLTTLPPPRLHEVLPGFHDTPGRYRAFEAAVLGNAAGRAAQAVEEIDFARSRKALAHSLLHLGLPERVTHNDTKINNVLMDAVSGEAICVIDLDTVMPGLAPYDFGDMVRTATCAAAEDERDLSLVSMRLDYFEALLRGYLSSATFLTAPEKRSLAVAGKLITFEMGLRFLTDYLEGDTYYKVHREGHNLDRCRTQFRLVASMEAQQDAIDRLVAALV